MLPYSIDFRLKVVRAYERGAGSQGDLARLFGVRLSFVQELLQRYQQSLPKSGGGDGNASALSSPHA